MELTRTANSGRLDAASSATLGFLVAVFSILFLFSHASYARFYLRSVLLTPLSLLHYVVIGKRLGHIPNPFFDPCYFEARAGHRSFFRYLRCREDWPIAPSTWFDPSRQVHTSAFINPLCMFQIGRRKRYASGVFDYEYVKQAVCRDHVQKRWFLFQIAARRRDELPMNGRALLETQRAFLAALEYRMIRADAAKSRSLVFIQAGENYDFTSIAGPRNFDLMLNYYDRPNAAAAADIVTCQPGTKTTAIANVMRRDADLLLRYDAVLFLDDDIAIDRRQVERLFDVFYEEGLHLAQPSLTAQSSCYFRCLKQPRAGHEVRRMNGVEIMMPMISRRVLREFGWVFSEGISGWGVDLLLSAKVRERFGDAIALIGEVVVAHNQPVDTSNGTLYRLLRSKGIDANSEAGDIVRRHRLPPYARRIRPIPET